MFSNNSGPVQVVDTSQCEQEYLVSILPLKCLAHSPLRLGKVIVCFRTGGIQETLIKNTVFASQSPSLALFFPLIPQLLLSKRCLRGCVDQTRGVNGSNRRKPNVRSERRICSLISISSLSPCSPPLYPLFSLLCEPAGPGEGFNLREQRIPWQRSTGTDGRRSESRLWRWSAGMSRNLFFFCNLFLIEFVVLTHI